MQWQNNNQNELKQAQRYAEEPWRITFCDGVWLFWDNWHFYTLRYRDGQLHCDCEAWSRKPHGAESCKHTRTLELLGFMDLAQSPHRQVPNREVLAILHGESDARLKRCCGL